MWVATGNSYPKLPVVTHCYLHVPTVTCSYPQFPVVTYSYSYHACSRYPQLPVVTHCYLSQHAWQRIQLIPFCIASRPHRACLAKKSAEAADWFCCIVNQLLYIPIASFHSQLLYIPIASYYIYPQLATIYIHSQLLYIPIASYYICDPICENPT